LFVFVELDALYQIRALSQYALPIHPILLRMRPYIMDKNICPICHEAALPEWYFCPNCGAKLNAPPLSTSLVAQVWLYAFSAILPIICFLAVTKWQGVKYVKSPDSKTKKIGIIACTILALSTILSVWYATVWIQQEIQSSVASINADMSGY
jgi:hypothetical protein